MAKRICQASRVARGGIAQRAVLVQNNDATEEKGNYLVSNGEFKWIMNCVVSIADDVLRGLCPRGNYLDAFLPITVLCHLDAVLPDGEQTEKAD